MRARLFACALAFLASACSGSSSTEVTAPSTIKCGITVENSLQGTAPAAGTSGTVRVTTTRDCTWTASSSAAWLTITAGASGQGSGSVGYTVAANVQPAQRRGNLDVNGTQVTVVQDAAPCRFDVSPTNTTIPANGGKLSITVETLAGCTWTARSSTAWMSIDSNTSGNGNGTVGVQVAANAGDARSGSLTIAGATVTVAQAAAPCSFTINPTSENVAAAGGALSISVTVRPGCAWTASSNAAWISVASGTAGSGQGTVALQVAPNAADARTGTVTIAGTSVAITQAAAPCTFGVAPLGQNLPVEGGTGAASVTVRPGCSWTAVSNDPWITVTAGAAGNGPGSVTFVVASNPGPPRNGTLTIAGFTFTVMQATVPCSYGIGPFVQFIGPAGGLGTTNITTGPTCPWTAQPNVPWIAMVGAASGIGDGRVVFAIGVNTGPARTGTVTVAGQTYTVYQDAARN